MRCDRVSRIASLMLILWAFPCLASELALNVSSDKLTKHAQTYLAKCESRRPVTVEPYEAIKGLLFLDPTRLRVEGGHLIWLCQPRRELRPYEKAMAVEQLESLLAKLLNDPAIATPQQAQAWLESSVVGFDVPKSLNSPLSVDPMVASEVLKAHWQAYLQKQKAKPSPEFQQLARTVDLQNEFQIFYTPGEIFWGVEPANINRYNAQVGDTENRENRPFNEWAESQRRKSAKYFAQVAAPIIAVAREALYLEPHPSVGGPLLSKEDAQSVKVVVARPMIGSAPAGLQALRPPQAKGPLIVQSVSDPQLSSRNYGAQPRWRNRPR